MRVDGGLVRHHVVFRFAVRHGHDVDAAELRTAVAPVAVREDGEASDLAAGLDLASGRHGPVKESVETGDALVARDRFRVLEKCRESSDDAAPVEVLGDLEEDRGMDTGYERAALPHRAADFI